MGDTIIICPDCKVKNRIPPEKHHAPAKCGRCGTILPRENAGAVLALDDQGFVRLTSRATVPVVVDFYSPTCGPCRMVMPIIEELARKYLGRAVLAKLDTTRYQAAASRHNIRGVPTILFFKAGHLVDQVVGAVPQMEIERRLQALL